MDKILKFKNEVLLPLLDRLRPYRYHLIAIGIAFGIGAVVGVVKASIAPSRFAAVDGWTMPQWTPFKAEPVAQKLAQTSIFTMDASKKKPQATVETAPAWRFTGTMRAGGQEVALIEIDKGQHVRRLLPGDELPGGAKVTAVHIGELVFADSTGEQTLRLYPDEKRTFDAGRKH
jgi:hypothetical protein